MRESERTVREPERLNEIKRRLCDTRNLAAEAGRFVLCYLIDMAILETEDILKKQKSRVRGLISG